jgi:propanol-preferring alcohol dehydrogenase
MGRQNFTAEMAQSLGFNRPESHLHAPATTGAAACAPGVTLRSVRRSLPSQVDEDTMRAIQISHRGGPFELVQRPVPTPSDTQVQLRVEACGVCHGENVAIHGHWPNMQYPRVPGHEIIGIVTAVGARVTRWQEGQRLGVGWSAGGHDDVTGLTVDGGYAEFAVAEESAAVLIPDGMSATQAAPLMCAGVTTFTALKHSVARMGDLVAVQGIGGLGHLALQYAHHAGFDTVAISRGPQKQELARSLGAHHYIDADAVDVSKALLALGGAKVVIATAPNAAAISAAARGLCVGGEVIIVAGSAEKLDVTPMQLLNRRSVRGWVGEGPPDIEETVRFSVLTHILPTIEAFPLEQATAAYTHMMKSDVRFRAVLVP